MLRIDLLGGFEVRTAEGRSIGLPVRKAEALLALLARHPGARHQRERIAGMLWADSSQARARASLRQTLRQLRQALSARAHDVVVVESDSLALNPGLVEVDVAGFERAHDAGTPASLKEAARLYRGEFLAEMAPPTGPFAEWVDFERKGLRERAVSVLSQLLPRETPREPPVDPRQLDDVIQMAVRLISLDPLQEHIHRLLMRLYLLQGRRGAALEQYRFCRLILEKELGVAPDPATEAAHRSIREDPSGLMVKEAARAQPPTTALVEAVASRPAVAVLPFTNLNRDSGKLYLSDGMSEDIALALSGWRRFPVIATSSTRIYRNQGDDLRKVALELGARYLVTGSMRRTGRRARIHTRLVDAESGHLLWAERYHLTLDDILAAQEECAERIAAAVEPRLERAALSQIVAKRTEDLTAWDRCLQGNWLLNRFTRESNAEARSRFQQALALDPSYSDAFTGLADAYLYDILLLSGEARAGGDAIRRSEPLRRAREAAEEAVALDPGSSAAHLALGHVNVWAQRFDAAISETELAIELNPSNANARRALGNRFDLVGRTAEGIAQMERAFQLNPRDPRRWLQIGFLTRAHVDARHYDEALSWAQQAVALKPDQPDPHFRLAICLAHLGRKAEARTALVECDRLRPGFVASKAIWRPYSEPARNEHFFAGLRRLSLLGR